MRTSDIHCPRSVDVKTQNPRDRAINRPIAWDNSREPNMTAIGAQPSMSRARVCVSLINAEEREFTGCFFPVLLPLSPSVESGWDFCHRDHLPSQYRLCNYESGICDVHFIDFRLFRNRTT